MHELKKQRNANGANANLTYGFTLFELLIAISIFVVVALTITFFGLDIINFSFFFEESISIGQEIQLALIPAAQEIRSIGSADHGGYPISIATSMSFTFFSDIDLDGSFEKISYFLSGNTLKRGVTKSNGVPPVYDPGDENITEIADYIVSNPPPIFLYYPSGTIDTEQSLTEPINIPSIRTVRISLTIDKNTLKPPGPTTGYVNATIRNMRTISQ